MQKSDLPALVCERVRLRGFREDDLEDLFALHADPRVMRYWSFPAWTSIGQAGDYFASALAGNDASRMLCWAMAESATDRLIGTTTLFAINREQGRAEIGYALAASHWGQGLARQAVRRVIEHAFGELQLRRIEADIDPRNTASAKLLERLGFVREGLLRDRWHVGGETSDSALYGLLAPDFK